MKRTLLTFIACLAVTFSVQAQDITVDEVINSYLENTGGIDNWKALKGIKMMAEVNQGGMVIPLEIVSMTDGKQYTSVNFQGNSIMQGVFDGETLWSTNFQTMAAEKADAEMTANMKLDANDFPDSFLDYKEKGYEVELMGEESIDGADTYKVKLVKEPKTIDGKEVADVSFYYFDKEYFVILAQESEVPSGPMAGKIQRITSGDYREVGDLIFPFAITQGIKDGQSQPITITEIVLDPEVDETVFAFPAPTASSEE